MRWVCVLLIFLSARLLTAATPVATPATTPVATPVAPPATQAGIKPPGIKSGINELLLIVTRADVAQAYLAFEKMLHDHPPAEKDQPAINRAFDRLAFDFETRKFSTAVRELHELSDSLAPTAPQTPRSAEAKLARALRVRVNPWVASVKFPTALRLKISPLYAIEIDHPTTLRLQITAVEGGKEPVKPIFDKPIEIATNGLTPPIVLEQPAAAAEGRYRIDIVAPDGYRAPAGDWYLTERPIAQTRRDNFARLESLRPATEQFAQAMLAVAARNGLLDDQFSEIDSARMLMDPIELARSVGVEVAELEANRDPFIDRPDDYWRTIALGSLNVPARVYAPKSALAGKRVPLVIALNGAGGDENLFMEGYGAGEIKRQADRLGFVLVTPRTDFAMIAPNPVGGIVAAISFDYLIDPSRVYVLGHSLGAITAQKWNAQFGGKLAGVCQIAGGMPFALNRQAAPTLLIAGDLDPIFPAGRLESFAADAKHAGLAVEFRSVSGRGHTLLVGENLGFSLDWLMKHSKPAPATHPASAPVK